VLKKSLDLFEKINNCAAIVVGLIIIFTMLAVTADVIGRYFLGRPIGWVLEITEYCLLYIPFLGAAWLLKKDGHVRIDVVLRIFNEKHQNYINIFTSFLGAATCLFAGYYGAAATIDHFRRGLIDTKILEMPKYIILIVIPFGFISLSIEFVISAFELLKNRE
jgi:TRAP-type C4-dicarboxylate transport system permease small subunit